jgi:hypothetical protein
MRDCKKINEIEYVYDGQVIVPQETYITDFGEVYIKFKRTCNSTINIHTSDLKEYIKK